jgi:hypothetical protein
LEDGAHVLNVEASDLAGNSRIYSLELNIDSTPPVIHLFSPISGEVIKDGFVDMVWQIGGKSEVEKAVILLDGVEIRNATGLNSRSFIIEGAGDHVISLVVWDASGNEGSVEIPVRVDIDPAVIEWTNIPPPLTNQKIWNIEWSMNDDVGIGSVILKNDDNEMSIDESQLYSEIEFDDGVHVLELIVADLGGHISSLKYEFLVDLKAPSILIDREKTLVMADRIDLYFNVGDDPSGIRSLEIKLDDGDYESIMHKTTYSSDPLEKGNHVITIRAEDEAGNIKEEMYHFDITGISNGDTGGKGGSFAMILLVVILVVLAILGISGWLVLRRKRSLKEDTQKEEIAKLPGPSDTNLLPAPSEKMKNERLLPPANRSADAGQVIDPNKPDQK